MLIVEAPVRRVDQMKASPIARGIGRPRTTIGEKIFKFYWFKYKHDL